MIDQDWTLFLDRDGVINERIIDGYVTNIQQFKFKEDFISVMPKLQKKIGKTIVITNQQGIGKKLMSHQDLENIHIEVSKKLQNLNILIDRFYYCPHLVSENCLCRKPNIGLALQAQQDFPEINFTKSLMIGDSLSDIIFGKRLKMKTVYITNNNQTINEDLFMYADFICKDLIEFYKLIA